MVGLIKKSKQIQIDPNIKYKQFFATDHIKADLKGKTVRGGIWTIVGQIGSYAIRLGSTIILARLLTPDDYGLVAMVAVVTNFALMFNDMGLSMATVQSDTITHEQVSTLFWINLAVSTIVGFFLAAISPLIVWFYDEPRLLWITIALAATFPMNGFTLQHNALLRRQMRFNTLSIIQLIAAAISVIVGIVCAWCGLQYWTLVIMQLMTPLCLISTIWIVCPWRPGKLRLKTGVKPMVLFGGNLTGFNFMNYFSRNADNLLIGKFLGTQPLGIYDKAYQLLMLPLRQITYPVSNVTMPALSRLQNDPEGYQRFYYKMVKTIAYITMPLIAFMAVLSDDIILLVLGEQWQMASPVFKILAFAAFLQPVAATTGSVFTSMGATGRMFKWGIVASSMTVLSFIVGLPYGIKGVAFCYSVNGYILFIPGLFYAYNKTPVQLGKVIKILVFPITYSVILYGIIELMRHYISLTAVVNISASFIVLMVLGLIFYHLSRQVRSDVKSIMDLFMIKRKV